MKTVQLQATCKGSRSCPLWRPIASLMVEAPMEVTIQHLGNVKFAASARGHRVICDQPAGNGGSDAGMTPPEYLLVSLGTCAGFYAVQYLKARSDRKSVV